MPDLIAQGSDAHHRWRRPLALGRVITLGRKCGAWSTPWDDCISRRHVEVCWADGNLRVERLDTARNPVFFRGKERKSFEIKPGEHFVIGGTTFTFAEHKVTISFDEKPPVTEQAFSPLFLDRVRFRDADQRIDVLARLPEIIAGATSDQELFVQLVNVLLTGIARATAAAIVVHRGDVTGDLPVQVLHWDSRGTESMDFRPSIRLIQQAVTSRESIVHTRPTEQDGQFTAMDDADWAFCTPVRSEMCRGWAIYVAGHLEHDGGNAADPNDLTDDLKFAELASTTLSRLRETQVHSNLRQFLSPVVMEALIEHDPDTVLNPRETQVTVLFCDLRGFSRSSEQHAENLHELLNRVSQALGVMTHHILDQGGVVGDFHGDSAMGFWGWPIAHENDVERACKAALGIRSEFEAAAQQEDHPLHDFRIGIGIASGRAVAGKIGSVDQVKVTVFGPVVNLAARLEQMTKVLRAPILVDETTAKEARGLLPEKIGRFRRVARVRPDGMKTALEVSELLPSEEQFPDLSDADIIAYESALDELHDSRWDPAIQLLHQVPATDRVKDFLTIFIAQNNRTPPDDWDGVIPLSGK